jgi:hypothetical protein
MQRKMRLGKAGAVDQQHGLGELHEPLGRVDVVDDRLLSGKLRECGCGEEQKKEKAESLQSEISFFGSKAGGTYRS